MEGFTTEEPRKDGNYNVLWLAGICGHVAQKKELPWSSGSFVARDQHHVIIFFRSEKCRENARMSSFPEIFFHFFTRPASIL